MATATLDLGTDIVDLLKPRVCEKVFPLVVLEGTPLPAVTYQVVSRSGAYVLDTPRARGWRSRFRLTAVSRDKADCQALAEAMRALFDGYSGTGESGTEVLSVTLDREVNLYDPPIDDSGRGTFRTALEFIFLFREPA